MKNLAVLPLAVAATLAFGACAEPRSSGRDKGHPSGSPDLGAAPNTSCTTTALDTDPHHCGSCTNDCAKLPGVDPSKVACKAGVCQISGACATGRAHCSTDVTDGCETDITTAAHCGTCDTACNAPNASCTAAGGSYTCQTGCSGSTPTMCGTDCTDTNSDINHCGACDKACPNVANGSATCSVGQCGLQCDDGYTLVGNSCTNSTSMGSPDMGSAPPPTTTVDWVTQTSGTHDLLFKVWGSSAKNVFIIDYSGIVLNSDGSGTWKTQSSPGSRLAGLWGVDDTHVELAGDSPGGNPSIWSLDGSSWDRLYFSSYSLNAVWSSSATNYYVAGSSGHLLQSPDFQTWTSQTSGTSVNLWRIWGADATHVFVAGDSGRVLRRATDGSWGKDTTGTTYNLYGLWGSSATDVYAVGQHGTILHSDGMGTFTKQTSGITDDLYGIWGSGPKDIFAVGDYGTVLHSTGDGTWTWSESGSFEKLYDVWGSSATDIYAVGDYGTILHKK